MMDVLIVPVIAHGWKGVRGPGVTIYPLMVPLHLQLCSPACTSALWQLENVVVVEMTTYIFWDSSKMWGPCLLAASPGTDHEESSTLLHA